MTTIPPKLLGLLREHGGRGKKIAKLPKAAISVIFEKIPVHIANRERRERIVELDVELDRKHELPNFLNALKLIPANCVYQEWFDIGAAIHDYDPGPNGLLIFKYWSRTSTKHQGEEDQAACEKKWLEYEKNQGKEGNITKATIYFKATEIEKKLAKPAVNVPNNDTVTNINGQIVTLPPQLAQGPPIRFPDLNRKGEPATTCTNARTALQRLGLCCKYDTFHDKMFIAGHAIGRWTGALTDHVTHMLRVIIRDQYGFDPGTTHMFDATVQECLQHAHNPVLDYLESLKWDGTPRIGRWLVDYMGAPPTALNCEISRLSLIAAVRRARRPGCKFDQIIVLEGPEGRGKSLAIEILAGTENYSSQRILDVPEKTQQELIQGVWLYEIEELSGLRRAEIEHVKAFASRTWDRARPAYARTREDRPRQGILFATTNDNTYLKAQTGNRRFWPAATNQILLQKLAEDRDQLWAEAAFLETKGASIMLDEKFWPDAAQIQDSRREHDPWEYILEERLQVRQEVKKDCFGNTGEPEWRIKTTDIMLNLLEITPERQTDIAFKRVSYIMRRLGWDGPKLIKWYDGASRGYSKTIKT